MRRPDPASLRLDARSLAGSACMVLGVGLGFAVLSGIVVALCLLPAVVLVIAGVKIGENTDAERWGVFLARTDLEVADTPAPGERPPFFDPVWELLPIRPDIPVLRTFDGRVTVVRATRWEEVPDWEGTTRLDDVVAFAFGVPVEWSFALERPQSGPFAGPPEPPSYDGSPEATINRALWDTDAGPVAVFCRYGWIALRLRIAHVRPERQYDDAAHLLELIVFRLERASGLPVHEQPGPVGSERAQTDVDPRCAGHQPARIGVRYPVPGRDEV